MIGPAIRSKAMKVFVYGTLQRGRHNHHILRTARFIGKAATVRKYGIDRKSVV